MAECDAVGIRKRHGMPIDPVVLSRPPALPGGGCSSSDGSVMWLHMMPAAATTFFAPPELILNFFLLK